MDSSVCWHSACRVQFSDLSGFSRVQTSVFPDLHQLPCWRHFMNYSYTEPSTDDISLFFIVNNIKWICNSFFLIGGFTPCKAEQPLGMELQEKKHKKDQIWIYKRYHSRLTSGQCLSILTSPSKRRKLFSKRKMFPIPFCNMLFLPKTFRHLSW